MAKFTIHIPQSAPEGARDLLSGIAKKYGFVPSLLGIFAENPAILKAYAQIGDLFVQSGLTPLEQQIVTISASVENECHFCVAAHTTIAQGQNLGPQVIQAVRNNRAIDDARLEALRQFTRKMVIERGFVADADVDAFLEAGYDRAAVLAVILGVGLKVLSNYTNHVAETPVDAAFSANAWQPPRTERVTEPA